MHSRIISKTENHCSLLEHTRQISVVLSDLDGLLVNSESFNQVFVHRTNSAWMRSTISRVVKSALHLQKFLQVLIKFITSERHPEWARHALVWLRFLLANYTIPKSQWFTLRNIVAPLLDYANEMAGLHDSYILAATRSTAVERWAAPNDGSLEKDDITFGRKSYYNSASGIPSTGYVFVDDSDDEPSVNRSIRSTSRCHSTSGQDSGSIWRETSGASVNDWKHDEASKGEAVDFLLSGDEGGTDLSFDEVDDDDDDNFESGGDEDESDSEDQLDLVAATPSDSDHGVFDVNDTTSSSASYSEANPIGNDVDEDDADADFGLTSDSDPANSDEDSVVGGTTSESDEETKFLSRENDQDSEDIRTESSSTIDPAFGGSRPKQTPNETRSSVTINPSNPRKKRRKTTS